MTQCSKQRIMCFEYSYFDHSNLFRLPVGRQGFRYSNFEFLFYFAEYPAACRGDEGECRTLRSSQTKFCPPKTFFDFGGQNVVLERSRVGYSASKNEPQRFLKDTLQSCCREVHYVALTLIMFTGIIEEIGVVASLIKERNLFVLAVKTTKTLPGTKAGDSVAVEGVCLTVTKIKGQILTFDIMKETIESSTLKSLRTGHKVNLERALKATSRFGGHFVTGHVDTVGKLKRVTQRKNFVELHISAAPKILKVIVPKGSVAVNGVSLTVGQVWRGEFSVYLIPFTLRASTLGKIQTGDGLNIETDILAKYFLGKKLRKGK